MATPHLILLALEVCACTRTLGQTFSCGSPEHLTTDNGVIDSHGGHAAHLNYGKNMDCMWTIEAPNGMFVQIWTDSFDIEDDTTCKYDYLELFDGRNINAEIISLFCGTSMELTSSTQNFLTVHFVSDDEVQMSGFRLHYNFTSAVLPLLDVVVCDSRVCPPPHDNHVSKSKTMHFTRPRIYAIIKVYDHVATTTTTTSTETSRSPPIQRVCDRDKFRCDNYKCVPTAYTCDGDDDCGDASDELSCPSSTVTCATDEFLCHGSTVCIPSYWLCDGDSDCHDASDELPNNCLTVPIATLPIANNSSLCGQLTRTGAMGSITSPNYPSYYGNNILCQWRIHGPPGTKSISLTFDNMFSIELDSSCSYDYVIIVSNGSSRGPFCGDTSPGRLVVPGGETVIEFSTDDSDTFMGFSLDWQALHTDFNPNTTSAPPIQNCRHTLSITGTGSVLSPYFGHTKYPPNAICTWKLIAPPGKIIRLHFNGFKLENSTHCAGDNVRIFDGINSNANVLGDFCGHTSPPDLLSTGHQMLVFFYSDSAIEDEGFNISYSVGNTQMSVFKDDGCHGKTKVLTSSVGQVTSPGYDGFTRYENSQDCSWRIDAPSGSVITLTFSDILTEKIEGCTYDYLAIYDGASNQSARLARLCGLQFPDDITSSGTSLFVHFVSDADVAGTGFSLSYTVHPPVAPCSQFLCGDGGCVGQPAVCNTTTECPDNTDEVVCVDGGCGHPDIAPTETSHKIVGGREAIPHSWPWMVSLRVNGTHTCGGTLLSQSWVMTAAHCFEANRRTSDWSVAAGKHQILKPELTSQVRAVGKIIVNSRYNFMTTDNDVALVKLTVPFYRNIYVSSACLPATEPIVGDGCFVLGWGEVEGTCCPGVLKQAMLPIMNSTKCNQPDYLSGQVTTNMFCAGYDNGGQDACQGDSGGPLLCKIGDQWHVQGITSFGSGCADVHSPGVYTRVYNYLRWIRQKIALN